MRLELQHLCAVQCHAGLRMSVGNLDNWIVRHLVDNAHDTIKAELLIQSSGALHQWFSRNSSILNPLCSVKISEDLDRQRQHRIWAPERNTGQAERAGALNRITSRSSHGFHHSSSLLTIYLRPVKPVLLGSEILNAENLRQGIQRWSSVTVRNVHCLRPGNGGFLTAKRTLYWRHR